MPLRRVYRNYVSNNLFVRMILIFSAIAVLTIVTLSYFTFYFMSQSIVQSELNNQKNAMERVNRYINGKYESVQLMLQNIYRDPQLSDNVTYLLKHSFQDYVKHTLDQFSNNVNSSSDGLDYFRNIIENDPDIENILLYSAEKQFLYVNSQRNISKLIDTNASRSFIPDAMALQSGSVSVPNEWVRKAIKQREPRLYSVQSAITDIGTLKTVGQLIVYFNSERISNALSSFVSDLHGYILVLASDGQVVFDSSDKYYGSVYPYADKLNTLTGSGKLEQDSYISVLTPSNLGYVVVGIAPKREVADSYRTLKRLIIIISAACILIAVIVPSLFIINYAKRTNKIIRSMRKVETGDMSVRIQDSKDDELGQISRGFNKMLGELTRHIDRVYKAEIRQKHTELTALQARINPHFLYNTLEVIRMRAISQGITDVSEMIYSLAVLFKSFVQQRTVVTLREETENCRRYLELFRIRYKDKFSYHIEYEPELADRRIIKMSLQPIVENYIIHGIQADRTDNVISVRAAEEEGIIRIVISDNGTGIPQDKLDRILRSFHLPETGGEESSLGLRSVHERLKLMYGESCGIEVKSESLKGTTVIIWFPISEEGESGDV
ncbi:sensor histidine kinase [Paenibacillus sp. sptzw28]|uniref:sensor histidine kinase n=1 Tax=Paenibacillus sp. sptzw28 TaxID=715179 RepID=UPI001C6F5DA9|nr:histidine kinase [Paenibacillus sp. sptzw28]QYR21167.1 sensor histidine kinase [Paenibacillus sp. sptzw28]